MISSPTLLSIQFAALMGSIYDTRNTRAKNGLARILNQPSTIIARSG